MKLSAKAALGSWIVLASLAGVGLIGCSQTSQKEVFAPTPPPADFAIVLDATNDTYYARQDVRQVITVSDLMSRTTYTTRRDYKNTTSTQFTTEHPLSREQVQAMWDQVAYHKLLNNGHAWYYWETNIDSYRRTEQVLQIRANGKVVSYKQLNHWDAKLRDLALEIDAARFQITEPKLPTAPVVTAAPAAPAVPANTEPGAPAAAPETQAATAPATTAPATQP
jgi:hypothetical protein